MKFPLTFLPGSRDSPPVVPPSSVLLPRLPAAASKAEQGFALTIGVKLVQCSAERGGRRRAAVIFDTAFASGEAPRALGCFRRSGSGANGRGGGRAGARGAEVRGTNRIPRPAAHGDAVKVLSWSDWDAVRNLIRGLNPDPRDRSACTNLLIIFSCFVLFHRA